MDGHDYTFGAPYPRDPWNEIIPGLWMGGHVHVPSPKFGDRHNQRPVRVAGEFDYVMTLCDECQGHGPNPGVDHETINLLDGELDEFYAARATWAAGMVHGSLLKGQKVLVRCHAGYNRSGLVIALVLIIGQSMSADDAINLIREKRSKHALHNHFFVDYLKGL